MQNEMQSGSSLNTGSIDTKGTVVYNKLKSEILNNKFEPGTVMVERKLCEMYDVSRSPIRSALSALSAEGILDVKPGKGIVVPEYTLEDILEIYDLIEILQVYALQVSIKNYTDANCEELYNLMSEMDKYLNQGNLEEKMKWDTLFHNSIVHFAGNRHLDMLFELVTNHKRRFDIAAYDDAEHGELTSRQHHKIYQAIKERNLQGATDGIKEHCDYIKKYYINKLINKKHNITLN